MAKSSKEDAQHEIDRLRRELDGLGAPRPAAVVARDTQAMVQGAVVDTVAPVTRKLGDPYRDFDARRRAFQDQADARVQLWQAQVRARPWTSASIALGSGYLLRSVLRVRRRPTLRTVPPMPRPPARDWSWLTDVAATLWRTAQARRDAIEAEAEPVVDSARSWMDRAKASMGR